MRLASLLQSNECMLRILLCTFVHLHTTSEFMLSHFLCGAQFKCINERTNSLSHRHTDTHTRIVCSFCVLRTSALTFNFIYYFYLLLFYFFLARFCFSLSLSRIFSTSLTFAIQCVQQNYSNFIWIDYIISFTTRLSVLLRFVYSCFIGNVVVVVDMR